MMIYIDRAAPHLTKPSHRTNFSPLSTLFSDVAVIDGGVMSGFCPPHHPFPYLSAISGSMVLRRLFLFANVLHIAGGLGHLFSTTTAGGLGRRVSTTKVRSIILSSVHFYSNTNNPPLTFLDSSSARVVVGVDGGFFLDGCCISGFSAGSLASRFSFARIGLLWLLPFSNSLTRSRDRFWIVWLEMVVNLRRLSP